jgi:hypothetical protein
MGLIRAVVQYGSAQVFLKLGRCAFCMGFALAGAVIGWAVLGLMVSFWPGFPYLHLIIVWPVAFTALWLLHINTFAARRVVKEHRETTGPIMTRRRVAVVFASALGLGVLISATAAPRAMAGGFNCTTCCNECQKHGLPCNGCNLHGCSCI